MMTNDDDRETTDDLYENYTTFMEQEAAPVIASRERFCEILGGMPGVRIENGVVYGFHAVYAMVMRELSEAKTH